MPAGGQTFIGIIILIAAVVAGVFIADWLKTRMGGTV